MNNFNLIVYLLLNRTIWRLCH